MFKKFCAFFSLFGIISIFGVVVWITTNPAKFQELENFIPAYRMHAIAVACVFFLTNIVASMSVLFGGQTEPALGPVVEKNETSKEEKTIIPERSVDEVDFEKPVVASTKPIEEPQISDKAPVVEKPGNKPIAAEIPVLPSTSVVAVPAQDVPMSVERPNGALSEGTPRNEAPAAAYQILYLFQKEGRLLDFLMEEISEHDDETLGGAIRPIHEGCRRILKERLVIEPVLNETEGNEIKLGDKVDPNAVKLTGNVPIAGPYAGILVHKGWKLKECRLPDLVSGWSGKVIAPAEVEISLEPVRK